MNVALIGIAGYGEFYLRHLLADTPAARAVRLAGVVDIAPERCSHLDELRRRGVPVWPTMEALYDATCVDLSIIATPIHFHARQTRFALDHGSHVLCEKPLAGNLAEATQMLDAQEQSGRFVAIGFQWSFTQPVQALKRDIMAGLLGKPIRMRSIVHYPRGLSYFRRNNWVGRLVTAGGQPVLDSPANNATAHFLHNMLYLLGDRIDTAAMPAKVQAELYRANDIGNYDTAAMRVMTDNDVEVLFYTSHCVPAKQEPLCRFEFEKAVVEFDGHADARFVARFQDGRIIDYGEVAHTPDKLWHAIECVRTGGKPWCGIGASMAHLRTIVAAQRPRDEICTFPTALVERRGLDDEHILTVTGLDTGLMDCYQAAALPGELRLPWSERFAHRPLQNRKQLMRSHN
jgi:predicted dehydrogenase